MVGKFESKNTENKDIEVGHIKDVPAKTGIEGNICISTTFNNIIVTLVVDGNVIGWSSGGKVGINNASKRGTPYAGELVGNDIANIACSKKVSRVHIIVKGPGACRESAIRAICNKIEILDICDKTPIPHGGCRQPKKRRI